MNPYAILSMLIAAIPIIEDIAKLYMSADKLKKFTTYAGSAARILEASGKLKPPPGATTDAKVVPSVTPTSRAGSDPLSAEALSVINGEGTDTWRGNYITLQILIAQLVHAFSVTGTAWKHFMYVNPSVTKSLYDRIAGLVQIVDAMEHQANTFDPAEGSIGIGLNDTQWTLIRMFLRLEDIDYSRFHLSGGTWDTSAQRIAVIKHRTNSLIFLADPRHSTPSGKPQPLLHSASQFGARLSAGLMSSQAPHFRTYKSDLTKAVKDPSSALLMSIWDSTFIDVFISEVQKAHPGYNTLIEDEIRPILTVIMMGESLGDQIITRDQRHSLQYSKFPSMAIRPGKFIDAVLQTSADYSKAMMNNYVRRPLARIK